MSVLLPALLGASLLAQEPSATNHQVTRILADDRFYFCQADTEFVASREDLKWCDLAATNQYRGCPGFKKICETKADGGGELESGLGRDSEREDETRSGRRPAKLETETEDEPPPDLSNLGPFAKLLMWLLLLGLVAWVAYQIIRNLVRDREGDDDEAPPLDDPGSSLVAARIEAMRVVETDVQRLLARAEAAAARGDHEAAIADVHAALLRRLEGERLISVDRWKTNGDYLHSLDAKPELRAEVREVVRSVEQVQFGSATADGERYAALRAKVLAIVSRASLALLVAMSLGGGLGCDEPGPIAIPRVDVLGTGPSGQRAIGELLIVNDIDARQRHEGVDQLSQSHGAIVLLAEVEPTDEDWQRLLDWVEDGGVLVIASGVDFPRRVGLGYAPASVAQSESLVPAAIDGLQGLGCAAPPSRALAIRERPAEVLLERAVDYPFGDGDPHVVARKLGEGRVIVFADPELLTNAALLVDDNAEFLVEMFRWAEVDEVEFVGAGASDNQGADNPFESMSNAHLGALFLQVLLFLALLYAAVGIPFARLRDPPERRRRSFAEHVRTLGQRYAQARAARHVAALYAGWALDRLRQRLQPGGAHSLHGLAQTIAARTGQNEAEIMQLLVEAHGLREDTPDARGGAAELELMRRLSLLLHQTR